MLPRPTMPNIIELAGEERALRNNGVTSSIVGSSDPNGYTRVPVGLASDVDLAALELLDDFPGVHDYGSNGDPSG